MIKKLSKAARDVIIFDSITTNHINWKKQIFDEYCGLVRGLMIKSIGPHTDVDDLVSDTFVGLFESAKNIRSADGLRSYVVSVAMNVLRGEFRRKKKFKSVFVKDDGQENCSLDNPKAKTALLQLHKILETLKEEDRLLFVFHILEEIPLQEVANNLSISISTAKRKLKKINESVLLRVSKNPLLSEFVYVKKENV